GCQTALVLPGHHAVRLRALLHRALGDVEPGECGTERISRLLHLEQGTLACRVGHRARRIRAAAGDLAAGDLAGAGEGRPNGQNTHRPRGVAAVEPGRRVPVVARETVQARDVR